MKNLLTILIFLAPVVCFGQPGGANSLPGDISVPALQSIKVELVNPTPVRFSDPNDIVNSKLIPGLYRITVVSNIPWVVNVSTSSPFLNIDGINTSKMPSSAVELRGNTGIFIPLTTSPVTILKSTNERIINVFYVDVRMKAEFEYGSGQFNANLRFSISPE